MPVRKSCMLKRLEGNVIDTQSFPMSLLLTHIINAQRWPQHGSPELTTKYMGSAESKDLEQVNPGQKSTPKADKQAGGVREPHRICGAVPKETKYL